MPKRFTLVTLITLLATACGQLPTKGDVRVLDVELISSPSDGSFQYRICDPEQGAWKCGSPDGKTEAGKPLGVHGASGGDEMSEGAVDSLVGLDPEDVGEQPVPEGEPDLVVHFPFDSGLLGGAEVSLIKDFRRRASGAVVEVHGYTDVFGDREYNNRLATQRAKVVFDILSQGNGIGGDYYGHGLCCYVRPDGSREQQRINRRAEVFVVNQK